MQAHAASSLHFASLEGGVPTLPRAFELGRAASSDDAELDRSQLLQQLFHSLSSLKELRRSKAGGESLPPSRPASVQPELEAALLEQVAQLGLHSSHSPTGPLSRESSTASLPSNHDIVARPPPHHELAPPQPLPAAPAAAARGPQPLHLLAAGAAAAPAAAMAPVQMDSQLQMGYLPVTPLHTPGAAAASSHQVLHGALPHGLLAQCLQQQWLFQQQLLLQQQSLQDESLVGPAGQYQSYCTQIICEETNITAHCMLTRLKALQQDDPPQSVWAKRFFCSIKEVSKVVHRAKCIIVAPDVKPNATANIHPVKSLCQVLQTAARHGVPVIFALSRRGIGQVFGREKSMSCVAVMSTEGVLGEYQSLLQLAHQGHTAFLMLRGMPQHYR